MADSFPVHILSLNRVVYHGTAHHVTLPSVEGVITVSKNHQPILGKLNKGVVSCKHERNQSHTVDFKISDGYYMLNPDGFTLFIQLDDTP